MVLVLDGFQHLLGLRLGVSLIPTFLVPESHLRPIRLKRLINFAQLINHRPKTCEICKRLNAMLKIFLAKVLS